MCIQLRYDCALQFIYLFMYSFTLALHLGLAIILLHCNLPYSFLEDLVFVLLISP